MPELPEVEVVRAGLERHVVGSTITRVDVLHPRPVRRDPGGPDGFALALTGRRIEAARRRGKYLWIPLDNGDAILGHLGMSGQLLVQPTEAPDERHLRVRFVLDGGERNELRFVDQRMFGGLSVSVGGAELPAEIAHIARDALDPAFDEVDFVRRVRRRTAGVKRLLLDQTLVSGVGNIYADEALWRARMHGDRPGDRLTATPGPAAAGGRPRRSCGTPSGEGGTSFDSLYVNVNGESGYFDRSLHVYGREGEPCDRCGRPMRRIAFMNRSSFFCPVCQPVPRVRRSATGALTRRRSGGTLEDGPTPGHTPHPGRFTMAKALIGYLNSDLRNPARLTVENSRLRARVAELEDLVLRLSQENDALAAAQTATSRPGVPRDAGDAARLNGPARVTGDSTFGR